MIFQIMIVKESITISSIISVCLLLLFSVSAPLTSGLAVPIRGLKALIATDAALPVKIGTIIQTSILIVEKCHNSSII